MLLHYKVKNTTKCTERDYIMLDGEDIAGECFVAFHSPVPAFNTITVRDECSDAVTLRFFMQEMISQLASSSAEKFTIEPDNAESEKLFRSAGYNIGTEYVIAELPALL